MNAPFALCDGRGEKNRWLWTITVQYKKMYHLVWIMITIIYCLFEQNKASEDNCLPCQCITPTRLVCSGKWIDVYPLRKICSRPNWSGMQATLD